MKDIPESVISLILQKASSQEINALYKKLSEKVFNRNALYRLRKELGVELTVGGFRHVPNTFEIEEEKQNNLFRKVNQLWRPTL